MDFILFYTDVDNLYYRWGENEINEEFDNEVHAYEDGNHIDSCIFDTHTCCPLLNGGIEEQAATDEEYAGVHKGASDACQNDSQEGVNIL